MARVHHPGKLAAQATYWRAHHRPDVAERLEAQLADAGRCLRCGRTLTDPASVELGVGPDCLARLATPVPVVSIGETTSCGHWMPAGMRLYALGDGRRVCATHKPEEE